MSNGHVLENAIREATESVAREGWEASDVKQITLAGFGYIAHRIENRRPGLTQIGVLSSGWLVALVVGVVEVLLWL